MNKKEIANGVVHKMPEDLRKALTSSKAALVAWENLTPLGRNEFICWIVNAKHIETRNHRIKRTRNEIVEGKRRPCCWAGCLHRIRNG
ncbi:YdeI/OmpD-associated family protein [Candidatus Pacearchaeota archaeon]|nr:YdeI/OmpD-associated family protein [Candidatus Pacearchaeota archaeon]